MRTNVVLEDQLINRAVRIGGFKSKRATIEAGLRLLIQYHAQQKLKGLRGKIKWQGNLERMRKD